MCGPSCFLLCFTSWVPLGLAFSILGPVDLGGPE